MSQRESLEVQIDDRLVGTLTLTANHKVAFSYSLPDAWEQKRYGKMEYDYSLCAKACGIVMTETRLFSSDICPGYFGTKRFDRRINKKGTYVNRGYLIGVRF